MSSTPETYGGFHLPDLEVEDPLHFVFHWRDHREVAGLRVPGVPLGF